MIGAVTVLSGCEPPSAKATVEQAGSAPATPPKVPLSPDLDVVKRSKGPVMTTIEEFYKVGPGPSSSHTIGPMRITYDFYQRCSKLPPDQLAKATALKVHLYRKSERNGEGTRYRTRGTGGDHRQGTGDHRSRVPRRVGCEARPDVPGHTGTPSSTSRSTDIIYDAPKGDFPHPNTMTCKLMAGDEVLFEQEYYSVGGGFIEWKGYTPPKKGAAEVSLLHHEGAAGARRSGQAVHRAGGDGQRDRGLRQERGGDQRVSRQDLDRHGQHREVRTGGAPLAPCRGRSSSRQRPARSTSAPWTTSTSRSAAVGVVAAYALAGSEENARGHLVVTAPTGGSAGVMPGARVLAWRGRPEAAAGEDSRMGCWPPR